MQTKKNWKKTEDWFTNRPLGKDNIKKNFDWLIEQLKETEKLAPEKNYVLHSIRGGTATNMNNGGIDKDRIKARTGHLNDSGLAPYLFHNGKHVLEETEL